MNLTHYEQEKLLKDFPKVELSYEKKLHKKVQTDICLTIPKGKKYFAWFKTFKKNDLCFLLNIDRKQNSIEEISVNICAFDKILCSERGTILYGTIFYVNKIKFFNIENIFYSRGNSLIHCNQHIKLKEIETIMKKYIRQIAYMPNNVIFGTPIIETNYYNLKNKIQELPYDLYAIQHRFIYKNSPFLNEFIKLERQIFKIFEIKASIINDIYDLYYMNNSKLEKYKVACIPNYKTSMMMNALFRNIKENRNLDLLEESDDEEEFENISLDKFVDLDKKIIMECVFIKKFDSWQPIKISKNKISPRREIICYKK